MRRLLREAMEAGAFGQHHHLRNHVGYSGTAPACRTPAARSWSAWCGASTTWGAGAIEMILNSGGMYAVSDEDVELLRQITQASGAGTCWRLRHPASRLPRPDFANSATGEAGHPQITRADHARAISAPDHVGSSSPCRRRSTGRSRERSRMYRDPRSATPPAGAGEPAARPQWGQMPCSRWAGRAGRQRGCAPSRRSRRVQGKRPVDAYFDLASAETGTASSPHVQLDPAGVERLIRRRSLACRALRRGAHVDVNCDVGYGHPCWTSGCGGPAAEPREGGHKPPRAGHRLRHSHRGGWRRARSPTGDLRPGRRHRQGARYVNDLPCNGRA